MRVYNFLILNSLRIVHTKNCENWLIFRKVIRNIERCFFWRCSVCGIEIDPVLCVISVQEAESVPGVGRRLAEKVWEIVQSGELRKLDEIASSEETKALQLFTNLWGAGASMSVSMSIRG